MRHALPILIASVVIGLGSPASAQTSDVSRRTASAKAAEVAGDYLTALSNYKSAVGPGTSGSDEDRTEAVLNYAHFLESLPPDILRSLNVDLNPTVQGRGRGFAAGADAAAGAAGAARGRGRGAAAPPPPSQLTLIDELLEASIRSGTPMQQNLARNELGARLLREKRNAEALEILSALDVDADQPRRHVYRYNRGRAFEVNGRPTEALSSYLSAVDARPAFTPAVDASLNLLETGDRPNGEASVHLVDTLLKAGAHPAAERVTSRLLTRWASSPDAVRLFALRLRWYVAAPLDIPACRTTETAFLDQLRGTSTLQSLVSDVKRTCSDEARPPQMVYNGPSGWLSANWLSADNRADGFDSVRSAFAAFLTATGQRFEQQKALGQALTRYLAAWSIHLGQGDGAFAAAMLLQAHPEIDRNQTVLNALIEDIFAMKGGYIGSRDWRNSQRMHIVLARIFEKLDRWGPVSNSHSALFQWTAAIEDDKRIRDADPTFSPSPGLFEHLADCYRRARQPNLPAAAEQYQRAAEEYQRVGRPEDAARVRQLAARLTTPR